MNETDYLIHYGVKGMKWGVRKTDVKAAKKEYRQKKRQNPSARKAYNKKIKRREKTKYTDVQTMSTKDLQNRVNRMNLERQYASLLKTQTKAVARGKAETKSLLKQTNELVNDLTRTKKTLTKLAAL